MERLPNDLLLTIFKELEWHDLLRCCSVCMRWSYLVDYCPHWKHHSDHISEHPLSTSLADLAQNSSRKLAFLCSKSLQFQHVPPFWNETELFLHLQEKSHELYHFNMWPHNLLFWKMLQLQLQPTGIRTPLAKRKIDRNAMAELRTSLLALTHYFDHDYFLMKLKEIAAVPRPQYFFSCNSTPTYISTMLLQHLYYQCEHLSDMIDQNTLTKGCDIQPENTECSRVERKWLWLSAISLCLDWNKQFVAPVQTAVIQALRYWVEALSGRELRSFSVYQFQIVSWLNDLSKQDFWVGGLDKQVSAIAAIAEPKATICDRAIVSPVLLFGKEHTLTDSSVSPKQAAFLLSQEGFNFIENLSKSEIFLLLYYSRPFYQGATECQLSFIGNVVLPEYVTRHCISFQLHRDKVEFLQRVISICDHLKQLKDFHKLKVLISAVRTSVSQTHLTNLTWRDLKMQYCKRFKELEDFMSSENCYNSYLSHVKTLNTKYVPYLPAHRACVLQKISHTNSIPFWPQCVLHQKKIPFKKESQFDKSRLSPTLFDFHYKLLPFVEHMVEYCLMD